MQQSLTQRADSHARRAVLRAAHHARLSITHAGALALLAAFALGCGASTPAPRASAPTAPATTPATGTPSASAAPLPVPTVPAAQPVAKTFADAVRDAAVAEPSEVSTCLTALIASNPDLQWSAAAPGRKALFVTWTSWNGFDGSVGKETALGREMWATAAPALQAFCRALVKDAPTPDGKLAPAAILRLEQLLGLPSGGGKDRFVEVWADPGDVFRPCPDPETNDHECSLDFPTSRFVTVSPDHVTWFNKLKETSYGDKGYPWTRLGYTYDWGSAAGTIGLSEFVIRAGATVEIKAVSTNDAYCR